MTPRLLLWMVSAALLLLAPTAHAIDFVTFESGEVRPLALSPDGTQLFAVNTPDNRLEIFTVGAGGLTHVDSVPVGMEPVAVAARSNDEVWVVNHLSDSVSIVDLTATPPHVSRTLIVGDEPRDIVFAQPACVDLFDTGNPDPPETSGSPNGLCDSEGSTIGAAGDRAFITTAHRGQQRTDDSIMTVPGAGDPQLTTEGIGRADVWVFDAATLGNTFGGTPVEILTFFSDTPRALAVTPDGLTVYVAAFHSGNLTTVINETVVTDGFGGSGAVPDPSTNANLDAAPETGLIVKFDGSDWRDASGHIWNADVNLSLPDHDVFAVNATTLVHGQVFDSVGTILFNMVVNPVTGKLYVTNTELPNHVRFEGPGDFGGSTVQGHLSESRITVIDPLGPGVDPQHLNLHIQYGDLHTDLGANHAMIDAQIPHSLATPLQSVVSSDGNTIYTAAFGSSKIGVFDATDIEDPNFEINFDPTTESANYLSTTGGGPAGLALDETNNRLYVLTRFNNSVEVIDLTTQASTTHALYNPEPPSVVGGRSVLYDAVNTSGNGEASCASCHIFADFDSLAWNLGNPDELLGTNTQKAASPNGLFPPLDANFHPMKGPMTTQTLRGLATEGGLHWRGDRVDGFFGQDPCPANGSGPSGCDEDLSFRNFIVAFEGLVGHDGLISGAAMEDFADFALQIFLPPNPIANLDNSLTADQAAGRAKFFSCGEGMDCPLGIPAQATDTLEDCDGCHELTPANGFFGGAGQQSFEGEPQSFKVPHMRNLYQKIGMFGLSTGGPNLGDQVRGTGFLHDGSVDTVFNFLGAGVFTLSNAEQQDLEAFSLAFPSDLAPIVGQQVTLDASNAGVAGPRIGLLIARAAAPFTSLMLGGDVTECDVIVKGTVGGVERGWWLNGGMFEDDLGGTISDGALRALAVSEGPLTYTAVPPGSGRRAGIDRDNDTLTDGVETNTHIFVSASDTGTDPTKRDSDGDGSNDGVEVAAGTDPNDPLDFPVSLPALGALGSTLLAACLAAVSLLGVYRTRRG